MAFGDQPLLDHADLTVMDGERIGVIGRNGTGKSSLLRVIAGVDKLDDGSKTVMDGLGIAYVEQEPFLPEAETLRDSLILRGKLNEENDEQVKWRQIARLDEYLHRFELDGERPLHGASGGEKRRAALALPTFGHPIFPCLKRPSSGFLPCHFPLSLPPQSSQFPAHPPL